MSCARHNLHIQSETDDTGPGSDLVAVGIDECEKGPFPPADVSEEGVVVVSL